MRTLRESLLDDFGSQTKDLRKIQIKEWLEKNNEYITTGLKINPDGTIDIDVFKYAGKGNFPDFIQFNKCNKYFVVARCGMTSLRGCPRKVRGYFSCTDNPLTSLKGCPEEIGGSFFCYDTYISEKEKHWAEKNIKCKKFEWIC